MRRLLFSLLALSYAGMLTGCSWIHSHGVCDCEVEDPCCNRAPWVNYSQHANGNGPINHVAQPEIKDFTPTLPKKL